MLENLIEQLIDVWNRHGNLEVGFLDEYGLLHYFNGYSILPKHSTIIERDEDYEDVVHSYHMKIKDKAVVLF